MYRIVVKGCPCRLTLDLKMVTLDASREVEFNCAYFPSDSKLEYKVVRFLEELATRQTMYILINIRGPEDFDLLLRLLREVGTRPLPEVRLLKIVCTKDVAVTAELFAAITAAIENCSSGNLQELNLTHLQMDQAGYLSLASILQNCGCRLLTLRQGSVDFTALIRFAENETLKYLDVTQRSVPMLEFMEWVREPSRMARLKQNFVRVYGKNGWIGWDGPGWRQYL